MRRFAGLLALSGVCVAAPVFAASDFGAIFQTPMGQKEYCVWSRAHIVYDNNTGGPVDVVISESETQPDGSNAYRDYNSRFERGETKVYYRVGEVINSFSVRGAKTMVGPLVFSSCNDKANFPAYHVVVRKDFTVDYWARSKTKY